MPLDNPLYYSGDTLEIPDDIDLLEGTVFSAAGSFFASLVDTATNTDLYVDDSTPDQPNRKRLDIRSIFKTNAIGSAVAGGLSIFFDPDSGLYEVAGDVIATAALGTAIFAAIAPLIPAGASVLFIGAVGVGVATGAQVIWNSFKEIDVVEDFFASADGNLPTNLEILDANGDIAGGVLYENAIDEQEELSAIDLLINESFRATDINISVDDFIRVVDEANTDIFDETRNEYRIYDGRLVDVILEEFNDTLINLEPPANSEPIELALSNLTNLGTRNEPNRNIDIYTRNPTLTGGFVYANAENRFFVPLPVANSEEIDVKGFHPGNIYYGTDGGDDLSVFENNTSFNSELETDNTLILGLDGDDFLSADAGTNFIFGGAGNDNISGIAGEDTVYFTDDFAKYDYAIDDRGVITFTHARGTQADGTDTLIDIEQAQFKDRIVSLPLEEQQTEPERDLGNYSVSQISEDNIIDGGGFISKTNVFWESSSDSTENSPNRSLSFNANNKTINELTIFESSSSTIFDTDYAQEIQELDGRSVFTADDGSLLIYDGSSLIPIPNSLEAADVTSSGDLVIWRSNRQLLAYNSQTNTTEVIADNSEGSDLPGISNSDYVTSENNVAWIDNGDNPRDAFLYDGETTIQITNESFRANSNLQINGNNILMSGFIDRTPEDPTRFSYEPGGVFYNGETIAESPNFGIPDTQNIDELLILENGNFVISAEGDIEQPDGTIGSVETLYLYDGSQTQIIHENEVVQDIRISRGIEKLTVAGDNIVWIKSSRPDGFKIGGFGNAEDLYLYNLNDENAQPIILNDDGINNRNINFQVSENQVVWATNGTEELLGTGSITNPYQIQLYAYDQERVVQLSDLESNQYNYIDSFDILDNGVIWVANDDGSRSNETTFRDDPINNGEVFLATLTNEETSESEELISDEEVSDPEQPILDEEEIIESPVNEDEPELENPDSLVDEVPENNSPINNPQETEIQLQIFSPDLESPITEPLISAIRIPDEYTELYTSRLDTSDFVPVDVNIDIDFGAASVPGRISFEVDESEGSDSFAPGEFNGYVFTDVFDEIPAIENVTLSETANSLGLESSDITFTENTIEVNVESLAYSPGLNALLDVEFADL